MSKKKFVVGCFDDEAVLFPAVKKVRDSILLVQKAIKKVQIETNSNTRTASLLDANQTIAGANSGMNVGFVEHGTGHGSLQKMRGTKRKTAGYSTHW